MKDTTVCMDDATANLYFIKKRFFNSFRPGGNKRSSILKINSSLWLQVCLSMFDVFLPSGIKF